MGYEVYSLFKILEQAWRNLSIKNHRHLRIHHHRQINQGF